MLTSDETFSLAKERDAKAGRGRIGRRVGGWSQKGGDSTTDGTQRQSVKRVGEK